mgnify:CR=1 FL=1
MADEQTPGDGLRAWDAFVECSDTVPEPDQIEAIVTALRREAEQGAEIRDLRAELRLAEEAVAQFQAERDTLAAIVRTYVETFGSSRPSGYYDVDMRPMFQECLCCKAAPPDHAADCALAALLRTTATKETP